MFAIRAEPASSPRPSVCRQGDGRPSRGRVPALAVTERLAVAGAGLRLTDAAGLASLVITVEELGLKLSERAHSWKRDPDLSVHMVGHFLLLSGHATLHPDEVPGPLETALTSSGADLLGDLSSRSRGYHRVCLGDPATVAVIPNGLGVRYSEPISLLVVWRFSRSSRATGR